MGSCGVWASACCWLLLRVRCLGWCLNETGEEDFDNTDEMKQQKKPPQKPDYDSTLTESGISDEALQNVNKFWEIYEIPNLLEYGESFFTKIFS